MPVAIATAGAAAGVLEQSLKEENDSLRWQLDSYRNEVELLRKERGPRQPSGPEVQVQLLQQSLHSVQQVGHRRQVRTNAMDLCSDWIVLMFPPATAESAGQTEEQGGGARAGEGGAWLAGGAEGRPATRGRRR